MAAKPEALAVLDVGKTNVKLLAIAPGGGVLAAHGMPTPMRDGPPYPHWDVAPIWDWLLAALAGLGQRFRLRAVIPTSCGSTAALLDAAGLVLPILDYEAEPPAAIARAYAEAAPPFAEGCCPVNPACLTLGRQLYWQRRAWPEAFARARRLLPFAQYWAWRLCGIAAAEVTSIGAQTQLWDPRKRALTGLAQAEGWAALLPPFRHAFEALGPLRPALAQRCGLADGTPVLCGIHDSNANYARYLAAGLDGFTLVSTGTWLITFCAGLPLARLEPARDMVSNTDLLGRPVACTRFMGGREYALIAGAAGLAATAAPADAAAVIAAGTLALPSFTDSGGPLPGTGGQGRIAGPPPADGAARAALASLYVALMTALDLDLLAADGLVIVDGGLAPDPLFAGLLAALRPGLRVATSAAPEGTALGAAALWGWAERSRPLPLALTAVQPLALPGLAAYAEAWRAAAGLSPAAG
jgi:sugar (pentulose or hexulose) kinase